MPIIPSSPSPRVIATAILCLVLIGAPLGLGTAIDAPVAPASAQEDDSRTLIITTSADKVVYRFTLSDGTISGKTEPPKAVDFEQTDSIDGLTAKGTVGLNGVDTYTITGDIESFQTNNTAALNVTIDGEPYTQLSEADIDLGSDDASDGGESGGSDSSSSTDTPTETPTPTPTATATEEPTETEEPTPTPTPEGTTSLTQTATPIPTPTPTVRPTQEPLPTPTPTPTPEETPTPTPAPTPTPDNQTTAAGDAVDDDSAENGTAVVSPAENQSVGASGGGEGGSGGASLGTYLLAFLLVGIVAFAIIAILVRRGGGGGSGSTLR